MGNSSNGVLLRYKDKYVFLGSDGISFKWRRDEVTYIFPWKRESSEDKWFSTSFMKFYPSLKAVDKEWNDYFLIMQGLEADYDGN